MQFEQINKTVVLYRATGNVSLVSLRYTEDNGASEAAIIASLLRTRFINWMEIDKHRMYGPYDPDSLSAADFEASSLERMLRNMTKFIRLIMFEEASGEEEEQFLEAVQNAILDIHSHQNEYFECKHEYGVESLDETDLHERGIKTAEWYPFSFFKGSIIVNRALKMVYRVEIADD